MFGSDASFMKFRFESHWLFQLLPPTVFALSGRLGLATPFGSAVDLPIEDRFFAGGSTTIRGYLKNRVGPLNSKGEALGGDALVIFNAEWRFPIWQFQWRSPITMVTDCSTSIFPPTAPRFLPGPVKAAVM